MSEQLIKLGLYRILRKLGVPREEVAFEADFDKDYFFSEPEKYIIFNFVEFRYDLEIPEHVENKIHNLNYLMDFIRQSNT